ncbi:MAG: signal recognition particle-docking protein FtsY [Planctomycetota bacterium]|nr:MAG: signal recognition particle-docking protein FtsY [Planctomycetota bacterium]
MVFGFGKKKVKVVDPENSEPIEAELEVEEETIEVEEELIEEKPKRSFFQKLKDGLRKTRDIFSGRLKKLFTIGSKIDQDTLDELEEILLSSDMGFEVAESIKESVSKAYKNKEVENDTEIKLFIQDEIKSILKDGLENTGKPIQKINLNGPTIITIIGVNGSGKTTSIAKLTKSIVDGGHSVMLAAADTFRAAAVEQLTIWSERLGVEIVKPAKTGSDPASVVYDATELAIQKNVDFLIIDTAGRLHTQKDLMAQLHKMHNVIKKKIPEAPHETILILDGTTGQNAVVQGIEFGKVHDITGLIMTKLDGSAKGGVLIRMCKELQIPIRYIGMGEQIDDLETFSPEKFVDALFE